MTRRKKYLILGVLLFMIIGFAAVTTNLVLNGTLTIGENTADFGIYFSKSVLNSKDVSKETISTNGQTINFEADLGDIKKTAELEYEVTNASRNYDAKVSVNCQFKDINENNSFNFDEYLSINYPNIDEIIEARSTGNGTIRITLKKGVEEEIQVGLECKLNFEGVERDSLAEDTIGTDPSNYSLSGYLIDSEEEIQPNTHLVILGNENMYITSNEEAYITINGLEMGFHEIYIIENKQLEEIKEMSNEEIKENSLTHATFTQSTKEITFENGYKIVDTLVNNKYTVYFNANGGEVTPTSKTVKNNETYGELPTPVLEGYNFIGWYTDTEYITQINEYTKVELSENQTLYAKWEAKEYTVNFNSDGGSEVTSKTVKYNSNYGELESPTKEGYNFLGWYLNDTLITSTTKYTSLENVTLKAKWDNKKRVITVDVDGTPTEVEIDLTKSIKEQLPTPTKDGYDFEGWYNDDTELEDNKYLEEDEEINIYTKFKAKKYTVNFNANTGSVSTKEVTYDEEYGELPIATKNGYNFLGWFTSISEGEQVTASTIVKITSNQTLYARYSAKEDIIYTVKHWQQNIGGDSSKKDDDNYTLINTETKQGTTGSTVEPNVNTYEGFTSPTKESIEVKGDGTSEVNYYYTRNSYTLTVNKDNGISTVNNKTSYQYEEEVNISYSIKEGYTFKDITGDKNTNTFTMPSSDVSININTTENTYTITYELDGGEVNGTNPSEYKVTTNDITLINPTKEGYTFTGWTGSNGEEPNKNVTIAKGSIANKTYTANWNPNTYTVTFNANGGESISTVLTVTYDATYGSTLPTPTRDGYIFNGWYTQETGGSQITSTTKVNTTTNQTLYAHWTVKSYEVTINTIGDGSVTPNKVSVDYSGTNTFTVTPINGSYLSSISCTNGYTTNAKTGEEEAGEQTVTISNNSNDNPSACTVTFEEEKKGETPITFLTNLAETDEENLAYDETTDNNLRYIGANPNNYVEFNDELWRIIGVMNNITDSDGNKASHVKLIRADSIGDIAWDSNNVSDWSTSTLKTLLNSGAYYTRTGAYSETGLTDTAKTMISSVVWNIGGRIDAKATASTFYTAERGTEVYSGRPTTWTGKVSLMYPSDYGYAVGGNVRSTCLATNLYSYDTNNCYTNDWLYLSSVSQWSLSPYSDHSSDAFAVRSDDYVGFVGYGRVGNAGVVRPVVYLNSNILIVSGTGTANDPYTIALP